MIHDFAFEVAVRSIAMEARDQGDAGLAAVAEVLVNRLRSKRWGPNFLTVCLDPFDFSCWNTSDGNRVAMSHWADNDPMLEKCRVILDRALAVYETSGKGEHVGPATHYYNPDIVKVPPPWVKGARMECRVGAHVFYSGVK